MASVLDRTKFSDRHTIFLIGATAKRLDVDINSLVCNHSKVKLDGTKLGQEIANFISHEEWNVDQSVVAMCFDTTLNTGKKNGACVLLERMLGKDLFWYACRYHIFEVVA